MFFDTGLFLHTAILAFTTLFAVIDPIGNAAIYAGMTPHNSSIQKRRMALKGTLIAFFILLFFMILGRAFLERLGISLAALRTAGGILLLLLGIDMVFARHSGGTSTTDDEVSEANQKEDISVFPLATPLIAGPGAIGVGILMMAEAQGNPVQQTATISALFVVMVVTYFLLLLASQIQKMLGVTGLNVINRTLGVLISALAVQFMFDGIAQSGLL